LPPFLVAIALVTAAAARAPADEKKPEAKQPKRNVELLQPYPPGYVAPPPPHILQPYGPDYRFVPPPPPQVLNPYPPGYAVSPYPPPEILQPYGPHAGQPAQPQYAAPRYYPPQQYAPQPYYYPPPYYYYPQPYYYPPPAPYYPPPQYNQYPQYQYPPCQYQQCPYPQYQQPQYQQPQYQSYPPYAYPPSGYTPPPNGLPAPPSTEYYVPVPSTSVVAAPRLRPKSRFLAKLSLGYAYHLIDGASNNAAAVELELGAEGRAAAAGARFGFELGSTPTGGTLTVLSLGPGIEWKLGSRFRLGMSPSLSFLFISPADGSDTLVAAALGAWIDASVDLVKRKSGGALFLAGRLGYDWMLYSDSTGDALVARAWMGYRF
jgi:hypothetical protein